MKIYKVKIVCPLDKVGDMLYEMFSEPAAHYMVYKDYWVLLRIMCDYECDRAKFKDWFTSKTAFSEFVDMCCEIQGGTVSSFNLVTGCLDIEREDGDSELCLDDVVDDSKVKPQYIGYLLPWSRKNLSYIANWVVETLSSKYDVDIEHVGCTVDAGCMDTDNGFTFEISVPSQKVARDLNIIKAQFERLYECECEKE